VTEEYLLGLERTAFMQLLAEPNTRARIRHLLETGKPLRN
jgi:3-hydroxyacyl-CoA dehydrogenase